MTTAPAGYRLAFSAHEQQGLAAEQRRATACTAKTASCSLVAVTPREFEQ